GIFKPANSVNPQVPSRLSSILDKMLARLPEARYQTASELIADLEQANLAAKVPSFVHRAHALNDPVVKAKQKDPQQLTRIDPESFDRTKKRKSTNPNNWYLQFRDSKGRLSETRAKTWEIIRGLQRRKIPPDAMASQDPKGEFKPLAAYPTFAPLV